MKTKINISMMIITSILCLLPLIYSFSVYNELPDKVGIPLFGLDSEGNYNRYVHKSFTALCGPLIYFVLNILLRIYMSKAYRWENYPKKMQIFFDWLVPVFSLFAVPLGLFHAMGVKIPIIRIAVTLGGIFYILYGNYMPKIKQNKVFKMKLLRTLNDPDCWNKFYRKGGYSYIISGIILIAASFLLPENRVLFALFLSVTALINIIGFFYLVFLNSRRKKEDMAEAV